MSEDYAWAAGLYEGEGSISPGYRSVNGKGGRCAHMSISMCDYEPVEKFASIVVVGKLRGPYANGPGRQPFWRWSVNRRTEVEAAIAMISPWLSKRRLEQIRVAMDWEPVIPQYVTFLRNAPRLKWKAYRPSFFGGVKALIGRYETREDALAAVEVVRRVEGW